MDSALRARFLDHLETDMEAARMGREAYVLGPASWIAHHWIWTEEPAGPKTLVRWDP